MFKRVIPTPEAQGLLDIVDMKESGLFSKLTVIGGLYMEPLHRDEKTGGIAIKITKTEDGLYNGAPQQVFAYTLDGAQVWYDLSAIFGEPFHGQRVEVTVRST